MSSCTGSNALAMAGCSGCSAETGSWVWARNITLGEGSWPIDSTVSDCTNFGSFNEMWDWALNYPDTGCPGESGAWPAMGNTVNANFTTNTPCPDNDLFISNVDLYPFLSDFRFECGVCGLTWCRTQVGFQYSTHYWIIEIYIGSDNIAHIHRGCGGSVVGSIDYTPVELGLPYVSSTGGCPIPNCRANSTEASGWSGRYIFAPAAGWSSPLNGSQQFVYAATSLTNAAIQAAQMQSSDYVVDPGWYAGPCQACDVDPFDSGLP
jgi:hypothetical protein